MKAWSAGIFPTMSMIFYAFAYITSSNGQWAQFSQLNTVSDDVMSVEVASDLLDPSQMLFVAVLYYGTAIATYFIQQAGRKKEKELLMLKINHLSKQFAGNEFYSLKDVSLEINKGEIVGLIGKTVLENPRL